MTHLKIYSANLTERHCTRILTNVSFGTKRR